jgi:pimeloyl-ACP methyl ester carboxylesterase
MAARGGFLISSMPQHASGLRYHLFVPERAVRREPLVFIHGVTTDPLQQFRALAPFARRAGIILLVPEFRRPEFRGYQQLASSQGPMQAAAALDAILAEVGDYLGAAPQRFDLAGYSGGAQFAHRYAMIYPQRVRRLAAAAAGWYTGFDTTRAFPHGSAVGRGSGGLAADIDRLIALPIRLMVGEHDVIRDASLRTTMVVDAEQGVHRLARAHWWAGQIQALARSREVASDVSVELLPDTAHSFAEAMGRGGLAPRLIRFLAEAPASALRIPTVAV